MLRGSGSRFFDRGVRCLSIRLLLVILLGLPSVDCSRYGYHLSVDAGTDGGPDGSGCTGIGWQTIRLDATPPVVAMVAPEQDQVVSGTVVFQASASDDLLLTGVRFRLGETRLGAEDNSAPFSHEFDTTTLPDGEYTLLALARDAAQNQAAASVTFRVLNNPAPPAGNTYYVCDCYEGADPDCLPGSDANAGDHPDRPMQSYDRIWRLMRDTMVCGDVLLFCRGGSIEQSGSLHTPGRACEDPPIRIGSYRPAWASADVPNPRLVHSGASMGFYLEGDLENQGNIIRSGLIIEDLHLVCTGCSWNDNSTGVFMIRAGADHIILRRLEVEGYDWGFHILNNLDVTIEYCYFHHNKRRATLGNGPGLSVRYNTFISNGCIDAPSDDYCDGEWTMLFHGSNLQVIGNEITRTSVDSQGRCRGWAMKIAVGGENNLISGNYIHEPPEAIRYSCEAITVLGLAGTGSGNNCTITRNRIENTSGGIVLGGHQDSWISNNTISLPRAPGTTTACRGIQVADQLDPDDPEASRITVANNSIFIGRNQAGCVGIDITGQGSGYVVANNSVAYAGASESFDCLRFGDPDKLDFADNNICHYPDAPQAQWAEGAGSRYDLDRWRQTTSFDGQSLQQDPGYTGPDAPAYDLSPLGCSDVSVDSGTLRYCPPEDFSGRQRIQGDGCDVGAFEKPR